ncbi:Multifunctional methyltransferase subunit TRM112-like protein [Seminavis robusta]|uniref:Multifunctional methyltransferase subunit TRM112-like protein n=1 Tax=Seminavis robusta TaxID=568900 RepID=A0A9N8EN57_9STRA|nr:Multifunctional methyltransferase subunit TRM112-like protein [Seminavis robusta]|eukprot:Sro1600_g285060.1 Multifunctional methyltransferase subunit TRM112-like protein (135) ;mRNA; f:15743-16147
MRLLTHNTLRNNTADAKGKGFPLKITATEIRVEETAPTMEVDRQVAFCKNMLSRLDWPALVQASRDMGIPTLPPVLTDEMAHDTAFLQALYKILMQVHLEQGMLTCPVTGREFPVTNGIPNMLLEEEECEHVKL